MGIYHPPGDARHNSTHSSSANDEAFRKKHRPDPRPLGQCSIRRSQLHMGKTRLGTSLAYDCRLGVVYDPAAAICISTATARRQVSAFFAYRHSGAERRILLLALASSRPSPSDRGISMGRGEVDRRALHTAVAVMGVLCAPRKLLAPWVLYSLGMVFCCVSTGQHWLVDCVAGMVVAGLFVFGCEYGAARWPFLADKAALDIEASGHRSSLAISAETEPPR